MRTIDHIIIHCSATREDRHLTVEDLETTYRRRGFRGIGYHYFVRRDGTVALIRPLEVVGARSGFSLGRSGGLAGNECDALTSKGYCGGSSS